MKVNTNEIPNYAEMTLEQKLQALESYEFDLPPAPAPDTSEVERLKAALNKASNEAAENKRALRERLSAEEQKAAQDAEEREEMLKELNALREEKAISSHKAAYMELGYDAATAEANAKALYGGDFQTVFANQKKFIETQKKMAATAAIDKQPGLSDGKPLDEQTLVTKEQFASMGYSERANLLSLNPELYNKLSSEV